MISTFSVTIVMSQEYLPSRIALASGLSVGLAIGLGGIATVILGGIADSIDLRTALFTTAAGPALGVLLAVWLPRDPIDNTHDSPLPHRPRSSPALHHTLVRGISGTDDTFTKR